MEKASEKINFNSMVQEIEEEKILLPDFQRRFVWTQKDMQSKLIASVLCKMPIGSILMLEMRGCEFAARHIGSNNVDIILETEEKKAFLLDGQQRVTVMVNAFSDLIHEKGGTQVDSLKRRYFLGIAKPGNKDYYENNYWGINYFRFPLVTPKSQIPEFMTEEIAQTLVVRDFSKKEKVPYNPYVDTQQSLQAYCLENDEFYLIPLYLLVKRSDINKKDKNRRLLKSIIKGIAQEHFHYLMNYYEKLNDRKREEWMKNFDGEHNLIMEDYAMFLEKLEARQEQWYEDMSEYLDSCVDEMDLHIMMAPNSNRAKAIEVFENLNRGGAKLRTFDLMMARAARNDKNFSANLKKECLKERTYPVEFLGDKLQPIYQQYIQRLCNEGEKYIALRALGCVKDNFDNIFQDTFLNVLALCGKEDDEQRKYREEMSRDNILKLSPEYIQTYYQKVCEALDRAAFFLQARCGIRNISEVNYKLMYTVLAYIFLTDSNYKSSKVWNLLTAWYWCAVFAGRYDKDQNVQAERDIRHLTAMIRGEQDISYIEVMQEDVLNYPNFSEKEFLLYQKSEETKIYPKEALGNYLCQFYLAEGYTDMFDKNVYISTFPTTDEATMLEKHHIVPLGGIQSIKESEKRLKTGRNEKHLLNSPINYVYITRNSNKLIGSQNVESYNKGILGAARSELDLPKVIENNNDKSILCILGERFNEVKDKMESKITGWLREWK